MEIRKSCFWHMRRGLATLTMHILERQETVNKVIYKKVKVIEISVFLCC